MFNFVRVYVSSQFVDNDMSTFGERLKIAFSTDSISKIAEQLGVSYQTVKNYVAGREPSADLLKQIRNSTNVSIDWLLIGEGEPFKRQKAAFTPTNNPVEAQLVTTEINEQLLNSKIRKIVAEELAKSSQEVQNLGMIDEFDLEKAVGKHDDLNSVLRVWYESEGIEVESNFGFMFSGWDKMSYENKVETLRLCKKLSDEVYKK